MVRYILGLMSALVIAVGLSACATKPKVVDDAPLVFDVRSVLVAADAKSVPLSIVSGTDRRLRAAIAATSRPEPIQRVLMDVRLSNVQTGIGLEHARNSIDVKVALIDEGTGNIVSNRYYQIASFTPDGRLIEESLANAVAARLRYAYALTMPPIEKPRPRTMSTRLSSDAGNQDPILNADTQIDRSGKVVTAKAPAEDPLIEGKVATPVTAVPLSNDMESGAASKVKITVPAADTAVAKPVTDTAAKPAADAMAEPAAEPTTQKVETITAGGTPAKPASDEPCVVTVENDCSAATAQ